MTWHLFIFFSAYTLNHINVSTSESAVGMIMFHVHRIVYDSWDVASPSPLF